MQKAAVSFPCRSEKRHKKLIVFHLKDLLLYNLSTKEEASNIVAAKFKSAETLQ